MPRKEPKEEKRCFLVVEGPGAGRVVPISVFPFGIGRLPENQLVLADDQVSRRHARIERTPQGPLLVDLGSRNGVFVNGTRISRRILSVGDRVRVGSSALVFHAGADRAREILAQSVPDSPAFALEPPGPLPAADEPTAGRWPAEADGERAAATLAAVSQVACLYRSALPSRAIAAQLVEILYQGLGPERVQISWRSDPEIRAARSRREGRQAAIFELPDGLSRRETVILEREEKGERRQTVAVPLAGEEGFRGWLCLDPVAGAAYGTEEVRRIETLALVCGGVLERSCQREAGRELAARISLMEKHLSPEVARLVSSRRVDIAESALAVEKREATVLFADIVGFTPLSERLEAEELVTLLNEYFQRMVDVILARHGTLNKFVGDAVMAIFGAPESHGDDAANAVAAGLDMVGALARFRTEIEERKRFDIRIGINTGPVLAGNIGSEKKMEYTVLGDVVNVANRLEGISPPNRITIGPRTAELVGGIYGLEAVPGVRVKGKSAEMRVFRVVGSARRGRAPLPDFEAERSRDRKN